jgi:hypothetical protein
MDIQKVIRNLFERAESTHSQNEAEQAILKAHELMAKHNIVSVSAGEEIKFAELAVKHSGNRKFRRNLANIIAPNFKCKNYISNNQIYFFGREADVKIAKEVFEYTYSFMYRETNRICRELRSNQFDTTGITNSYALGFLRGLKEKLGEQSTALMVIVPPDVKDKFDAIGKERNFRTSHTKLAVHRGGYAGSVYNQGLSDGRTVLNGRRLDKATS